MTSRVDYSDVFRQLDIDVLDDENDLYQIITYYYKSDIDEVSEKAIIEIISAVQGHTMALELIAKHMQMMKIHPVEMNQLLIQNGITAGNDGKVRNFKDGNLKSRTAYAHISALFNIFGLSEEMKQILRHSALIGANPIEIYDFVDYLELTDEQIAVLNSLINCGWIQYMKSEDSEILTLHPLTADVLCSELKPDIEHCEDFISLAAVLADNINELECDKRKLQIAWLDHAAHHIQGNGMIIAHLLNNLNFNVYTTEKDYENAVWSNKRIIEIIYAIDGQNTYQKSLLNCYLYLIQIYKELGNQEEKTFYEKKTHELTIPSASAFLAEELCKDAVEKHDYGSALKISQERLNQAFQIADNEYIARAYYQLGQMEEKFENNDKAHGYYSHAAEYMDKHIQKIKSEDCENTELADMYSNAGDMHCYAKNYQSALNYYYQSIELFDSEYGENNSRSGEIYSSILLVYIQMGNLLKELEYLEKTIHITEKIYGRAHSKTCFWYEILYQTYMEKFYQDKDMDALKKAGETAELLNENYDGETTLENAFSDMDYSVTFRFLDDKSRCYFYMKRSLSTYQTLLEEEAPLWSYIYPRAAHNFYYFDEYCQAKNLLHKAIAVCELNHTDNEQLEYLKKSLKEIEEAEN